MRGDSLRLADMLQALERIRTFAAPGAATMLADPKTADAIAYEVLKLGEAASQLSPLLRSKHPGVPWGRLIRQRNQMVHEYFRTDEATLWKFVVHDLDPLERELRKIVVPTRK
ncbi:MAG: DUF86 domain-containing protein [Thermoplasmata archaeon]|nr:DUF86 domain-containing protein [Thermoplasmata archaeon]MCI4328668.1 DUF86 domain-containing protein [Thermoplasmata archaeon]MCI4329891.1 DUF86 domain-containing protein [Thermoplasmata archaeon]MCI4332277.1 DUF86 domain-containing protein [Thermoplasmata archaeon]